MARPGRVAIVLDSSFLIHLATITTRVFEELESRLGALEFVVPSSVVKELERVARRKRVARLALEFAVKQRVVETSLPPDVAVVEMAKKFNGFVASMDRGVIGRARSMGVPYVTLKDNFPVIVGPEL